MNESRQLTVAELLDSAEQKPETAPEMLVQAYDRLRRLARHYLRDERRDHTLQATAVVHEAYMRLVSAAKVNWNSPAEFMAAAAETMRRILIDHAKARKRLKRGGAFQRCPLTDVFVSAPEDPADVLALDPVIERLAVEAPDMAQVVRLRYFVGLDIEETAKALGVSAPTVKRRWQWARVWLFRELSRGGEGDA